MDTLPFDLTTHPATTETPTGMPCTCRTYRTETGWLQIEYRPTCAAHPTGH